MSKKKFYIIAFIFSLQLYIEAFTNFFLHKFDMEELLGTLSFYNIAYFVCFLGVFCLLFYVITTIFIKKPENMEFSMMVALIGTVLLSYNLLESLDDGLLTHFFAPTATVFGVVICDFLLIRALIKVHQS